MVLWNPKLALASWSCVDERVAKGIPQSDGPAMAGILQSLKLTEEFWDTHFR